jgi:indolepyruvate ferredoxin oxidoreductase beta subunit
MRSVLSQLRDRRGTAVAKQSINLTKKVCVTEVSDFKKKTPWFRLAVCGVGGQGVLLASRILCEAAMRSDLPVVSGEIRNMAQRGGTVNATVILGGARSTVVPKGGADAVLAFEPMEAARLTGFMSPKTLVITNTHPVVPFTLSVQDKPYPPLEELLASVRRSCGNLITLDATKTAVEKGSPRALNMVMLGALAARGSLPIETDIIEEIITESSPKKLAEMNLAAFRAEAEMN